MLGQSATLEGSKLGVMQADFKETPVAEAVLVTLRDTGRQPPVPCPMDDL